MAASEAPLALISRRYTPVASKTVWKNEQSKNLKDKANILKFSGFHDLKPKPHPFHKQSNMGDPPKIGQK